MTARVLLPAAAAAAGGAGRLRGRRRGPAASGSPRTSRPPPTTWPRRSSAPARVRAARRENARHRGAGDLHRRGRGHRGGAGGAPGLRHRHRGPAGRTGASRAWRWTRTTPTRWPRCSWSASTRRGCSRSRFLARCPRAGPTEERRACVEEAVDTDAVQDDPVGELPGAQHRRVRRAAGGRVAVHRREGAGPVGCPGPTQSRRPHEEDGSRALCGRADAQRLRQRRRRQGQGEHQDRGPRGGRTDLTGGTKPTEEQADCIADGMVDDVGVETLQEYELLDEDLKINEDADPTDMEEGTPTRSPVSSSTASTSRRCSRPVRLRRGGAPRGRRSASRTPSTRTP